MADAQGGERLLEEGRFFSDVGKLRAAAEALREALEQGADRGHAHALLALNCARDSRWREAEEHLAAAERAGFAEPWLVRLRGRVAWRRGRRDEALIAFREAAASAAGDPGALLDGVCAHLAGGDDAGAAELLERLQSDHLGAAETANAEGLMLLSRGEFGAAREVLACFAGGEDCVGLNNLAVALVAGGEAGPARAIMREALVAGERTAYWEDLQHNRRLMVGQTLRPLADDPESDIPVLRRSGVRPLVLMGTPLVAAFLLRNLFLTHAWVAAAIVAAAVLLVAMILALRPGEYRALPLMSEVVVRRPSLARRALHRRSAG